MGDGMVDRENVIKGLEQCVGYEDADNEYSCIYDGDTNPNCPYAGTGGSGVSCMTKMMRDALALLKAQEPLAYWVKEPNRKNHWHCSNCGKVQGITSVAMKYCPECGSKMIEHPWAASGCGQAFSPD